MQRKIKLPIFILLSLLISIFLIVSTTTASAATDIKLIVDGKDITDLSAPIIKNDRTLVPIRFVSEEIGAQVTWDGDNRTVLVQKDNKSVFLKIDKYLIDYNNGETFQISDVAPLIVNDRTYVPLRLISNALGIGIEWDETTRSVLVDSNKSSQIQSFFDIKFDSPSSGGFIYGKTQIKLTIPDKYRELTKEIKILLLDKTTRTGFIVAITKDLESGINYLPRMEDNGAKILVAALYDESGNFVGGDSILVNLDIKPTMNLEGLNDNDMITNSIVLKSSPTFSAESVTYELTKLENGKIITITDQDPFGTYTWTPKMEQNGTYMIKSMGYDNSGTAYESKTFNATVSVSRKLSLLGVTEGMVINKPVNLIASRNFDVLETRYIIKDIANGTEKTLATVPFGSYPWFPNMDYFGDKELYVSVTDTKGKIYDSNPIRVKIDGSPKVIIKGIGPNQVLSGVAKLSVNSNVTLDSMKYIITNTSTGIEKILSSENNLNESYTFTPTESDAGKVSIKAECVYEGKKYYTEDISLTIYLGELYGPAAIIEKDKFLEFASGMAKESWLRTDMSAALQTAQAILETGWGQSIPVDKYTGVISNNLFGIKGTGSNGSVISNTWEVYNGITYRVDSAFRSYNNVQESWNDHKSLLLDLSRYEPFRAVMYDYRLGAWAVKRAGYATDPLYPIKLINIIKKYNLQELDRVDI